MLFFVVVSAPWVAAETGGKNHSLKIKNQKCLEEIKEEGAEKTEPTNSAGLPIEKTGDNGSSQGDCEEEEEITPKGDGTQAKGNMVYRPGDPFPTSPLLEKHKAFWVEIFTRHKTRGGVIHSGYSTLPVFEEVNLEKLSRRQGRRYLKKRTRMYKRKLRVLAQKMGRKIELSPEEKALKDLFPPDIKPRTLRKIAAHVRFQGGLADRFKKGIIRSGAYLEEIKKILKDNNVPQDLAYLPHVESSFNYRAYSKFGAAGIWQFIRGTGKRYMDVKYEVDERLDPIRASHAAAKFLRQNYVRLKEWPLAITAYNHGPRGVERIVKKTGTRDLDYMIRNYHGRLFKFASKNFYAEFLAARYAAKNHKKYFGEMEMLPPVVVKKVTLPFYIDFADVVQFLKMDSRDLSDLNLALRTPVIVGSKRIPKGYELQIPIHKDGAAFLASIPKEKQQKEQKRTYEVKVRRGQSLYSIGRTYKIPWRLIARANHITKYHRLRPGQRLVLPYRDAKQARWIAKVAARPKRKIPRREIVAKISTNGMKRPGKGGDSVAFQKAEGAALFQILEIRNYNKSDQFGEIVSAYGETLGHYADWAGVSTQTIREFNDRGYRSTLLPGKIIQIPFAASSKEYFYQKRMEYHSSREEDFFVAFGIPEILKIKVRRGDSIWGLAQDHSLPMWLFYQYNPKLVQSPIRSGMVVSIPLIEELANLEQSSDIITPLN